MSTTWDSPCPSIFVLLSTSQPHLGFPTGQDSATFWDKGTEVPSFSWDKGTIGQDKDLAKGLTCQSLGREGPGQPKSGTKRRTTQDRAKKDILEQENDVLKQKTLF